jgi:hypothetical protein
MNGPADSTNSDTQVPTLYKFVGELFVWLIVWFIVWMFVNTILIVPAVWLVEVILQYSLPEYVFEFNQTGSQALLVTHFGELDGEIVSARLAGDHLAFLLNTRTLSYSFPFYAALSFTTSDGVNRAGLVWGCLLLYLLMAVGMIGVSLKNLMMGLGPVFIDSLSTSASIIGIMFQFSTLMIPTIAPLLIWAWQSRNSSYLRQLLVKK